MTTTAATTASTASTAPIGAAVPRRLTSRRTAWIVAAAAGLAIAATATAVVSLRPSDPPRPAGRRPGPRRSPAPRPGRPRTGVEQPSRRAPACG